MIGARAVGILILSGALALPLAGQHPAGGNPPHTPQQQKDSGPRPSRLAAWLRTHKNEPPDQQEKELESAPGFKHLSPQQQAQLKERLRKFNSLPPDKQEKALRNMEYWEKLTPDQKKQIREAHEHMQTLPNDRRAMVQKELRQLLKMSANDRQQEFESDQFKGTFSDKEQTILKNLAEINRAPENNNPTQR